MYTSDACQSLTGGRNNTLPAHHLLVFGATAAAVVELTSTTLVATVDTPHATTIPCFSWTSEG